MAEYFHTCKLPHEVINEIQEIAQKEFATGLERKLFLREERIKIPEMRFFFLSPFLHHYQKTKIEVVPINFSQRKKTQSPQ